MPCLIDHERPCRISSTEASYSVLSVLSNVTLKTILPYRSRKGRWKCGSGKCTSGKCRGDNAWKAVRNKSTTFSAA